MELDDFVGSNGWKYFYLIALGIGLGFIISYFDSPTNLWYIISGIVSSLIMQVEWVGAIWILFVLWYYLRGILIEFERHNKHMNKIVKILEEEK